VRCDILEHLDEYPEISWDGRRDLMSLVCKFYFQYESSDRILKFLGKQQSALDRCFGMENVSLKEKSEVDEPPEGVDESVEDEGKGKGKHLFGVPSLDISSISIMSSRRPQTPPLSPRSPTWGSRVSEMEITPLLQLELESESRGGDDDDDSASDGKPHEELWRRYVESKTRINI
jgi:hypothetical protein